MRARSHLYLAGFCLVQILVLASTFVIPRTNWYLQHDGYPALRGAGYSHWAGRLDCQVLIYGDSTSLTGMDPAVIQKITGLKTCNVAEYASVFAVVGTDAPLRAYLDQNAPPRFLLSLWSASGLTPDIPPLRAYTPEGGVYAMQYGEQRAFVRYLLLHPPKLFHYCIWTLQSLADGLGDELSSRRFPWDARAEREAHRGQWLLPLPEQTRCVKTGPALRLDQVGRAQASVETFRRKYTTPGTTVIVDVSPVPVCDANYQVYADKQAGLYDNTLERLPIADFSDADVHLSAAGSQHVSEEAGKQIAALMRAQAAAAVSASR